MSRVFFFANVHDSRVIIEGKTTHNIKKIVLQAKICITKVLGSNLDVSRMCSEIQARLVSPALLALQKNLECMEY